MARDGKWSLMKAMSETRSQGCQILFATPEDGVVVLRAVGRATLDVSPSLRAVADAFNRPDYSPRYIVDLAECHTLDSTFMGVVASMAMHQTAHGDGSRLLVVNADATTERQLTILGLNYLLDIHPAHVEGQAPEADESAFQEARLMALSRFERIVHMIESHQALIDTNSGNEVAFKDVMTSLDESLEREKRRVNDE